MGRATSSPRGHYLAHDVGGLAGVSGYKIGQWARRGYIQSSWPGRRPRVYAFQDVAEAMLVHELELRNVPHREIKATVKAIREETGSDWPLTSVDGLAVTVSAAQKGGKVPGAWLLVRDGANYIRPAKSRDQTLLNIEVDVRAVNNDLRRGGWAARENPGLRHIEVDPDRLSGHPAIKGKRVPADRAGALAETENGLRILREDYKLSEAEIQDAHAWWAAVQRYGSAA